MTLAEAIMQYRARHKLSQEEFGEMCGFSRPTISGIERGKRVRKLTEMRIRMLIEEEK